MTTTRARNLRSLKRQRTMRLAKLLSRAFYLRQRKRNTEMYNLICDEMVALGGVYVKFLQGVLLNSKAMRKWSSPDRLKIFENLDVEPLDIVAILRAELSPDVLANITFVQPEPFAAGSFGQVYLAQHKNGKTVIVKVLRPQVRELLRHDLRLLSVFTKRFAAGEYKNISVKLDQAIKEFREVTLRETDYVAEASFARELFKTYKNHPYMVIPETYMDLCTTHLIVQDYIGGISAVDLLHLREAGGDPVEYIRTQTGSDLDTQLIMFGVESLRAMFTLPRVQGDPHPGNIRFLPGNKVGMIDFGIAASSPANKAAFFGIIDEWSKLYGQSTDIGSLFEQFMRFFVNDLYKALRKISSLAANQLPIPPAAGAAGGKSDNFPREVGRMMQEILYTTLGTRDLQAVLEDGRMIQIFNNLVNKGNRFGLVVRLESSEILRAAQTYMTLVEALGRRRTVLPKVFTTVVPIIEAENPDISTEGDEPMSITQALETINTWLERVAMRDPALFDKLLRRIKLKPSAAPAEKTVTKEAPEKVEQHA
ncbi:MAG TPA: AarF/ABC1/UbiB kinase family protein [Candidatus Saccharimonadales bacterium]